VVVVDHFDERLDLASFSDSFLTHSRGNFAWVALNASDKSVAERMDFGPLIVRFEDNGFATCIAAASDEGDFSGLQDC